MMKCKYCGGDLTLEQAFCPHCGRPNEEAAQHVKDMEQYKSNFEDTKSDIYEVAKKNTDIMSHTIIITVLVVLCVIVFLIGRNSYAIYRSVTGWDTKRHYEEYVQQMDQYLEDEEYMEFSTFCTKHYIRSYSEDFEEYYLVLRAANQYYYFYPALMELVMADSSGISTISISMYRDQLIESYEEIQKIMQDDDSYYVQEYKDLEESKKEAIDGMMRNMKVLLRTYFDLTEEETEKFDQMTTAQKTVFLEEKSEVMGYGKSAE